MRLGGLFKPGIQSEAESNFIPVHVLRELDVYGLAVKDV
jgi:hypothetical protein